MSSKHEYERPSVTSNGCAYATLQSYNQGYYGRSIMAPVPATTRSMEFVIPSFGSNGYTSLSGGGCQGPSCSGFAEISRAYPNYPNNCNKFTSRLCG